ncbi:methyl-accepting chemotaxis protein [Mastigocladopsis repens]|uniref:methyl-accepting chemotaxis protein n=1 Tax=Mastigocladopsis repens TaxID=221287 RepID=UPI0018DDEA90|nr:methyl-accepting chemotaxis protein [Mastigocladopsis repens]
MTTQLRGVALGLLLLGTGNVVSVYFSVVASDSTVVNQAGLVRGGTQRLVKLEMAGKANDDLIQKLDKKVNGLINGDQELGLPKATDPNFLLKLKQVENAWKTLKQTIIKVRQKSTERNVLLNQSEDLFKLTDETVLAAEKYSQAKVQFLRTIQLAILGITIAILAILLIIVHRITSTFGESIRAIATSSTQIASTLFEQEQTISLQASAVSQTTTTMNKLAASSVQSAQASEASEASARQALLLAEDGAIAIEQTMAEMVTLKDKVGAIASQTLHLSEQTEQIRTIAVLVSELAEQTNMLALKTTVDASRAGDQGKGIGIVAAEVRTLADRSKRSAQEINILVAKIQLAMNSTVIVTQEGTQTAESGIKLSQGTAQTFVGVKNAINNVFLNSQQISLNAKQQLAAVQQVEARMNAINQGAKEITNGIAQVRLTTQHLNEAAQNLKLIV